LQLFEKQINLSAGPSSEFSFELKVVKLSGGRNTSRQCLHCQSHYRAIRRDFEPNDLLTEFALLRSGTGGCITLSARARNSHPERLRTVGSRLIGKGVAPRRDRYVALRRKRSLLTVTINDKARRWGSLNVARRVSTAQNLPIEWR
jgi:hypothetical protein